MKKWIKLVVLSLGFLGFIAMLVFLHNQLKNLNYVDVINALKSIPVFKIILALFLAFLYYLILGGYDIIAFKYIGSNVLLRTKDILFTCFISNVLANNAGCSMLFGGSMRYRFYSAYNISLIYVTKVLLFSSATIWLGLLAIGGPILTFAPVSLKGILNLNFSTRVIGVFSLVVLVSYIFLGILRSKPVKIFKWTIVFPNIKIIVAQILLAICDWIIASLTLYVLMPTGYISYFVLLKVFLVTQFAVIISQMPGGMGVFEGFIVLLLPNSANNPEVIGALLAYRVIFYLFPLLIGLILLGSFEIVTFTKKVENKIRIFGKTVSSVIVQVISLSSFLAGMIAIFSTSTPFNATQLKFVVNLLPVWFAELSHFLLSITAVALLFISRALQLRIKSAWNIACVLIGFTIVFVVIVGESYLVLSCFVVLFTVLMFSRRYFYRDISILSTAFSTWWISSVGGVFVISGWIGFFINRQDIALWTHGGIFLKNVLDTTDAARFLRASLGMSIIIFIVILEQISRNCFKKAVSFTKEDIKKIAYSSDHVYALDALAPGKSHIVNDEKDAFIMYAKYKDNLIVLGDPVGRYAHKNELLWKFKEIADKASKKSVFVGIDSKYLQIYNDIGFDTFNIGQEAKILLRAFDKKADDFKYFCNLEKEIEDAGFQYKICKAEQFEKYRKVFADINAQWETNTNYVEKNFIPGKYDSSYMKNMDFGILEKFGKIYAFSILEKTNNNYEMSSGIVRYLRCSSDIFTYIIFKNILLAKKSGYKWFNMGLAYFSEIDNAGDAAKYFAKMFMFSEIFDYDLTILRNFKDKFCPMWRNKYIAIDRNQHIVTFIKNFTAFISPAKTVANRYFLKRFFQK
ncbi:MAG: phosphatidylglycerol lysyltransferase domain-containing protein [Endomicrobium sp.]|jgi:phosphatidylglycerol lysyltransferase|nr:phosphatidylglycerol lysyltransferase domain-containing protein [Endomicrobium sp.]